jgi:protocatechuate 3,4-dioxygenase beta subunit
LATVTGPRLTRRRLLEAGLAVPVAAVLAACGTEASADGDGEAGPSATSVDGSATASAATTLPATPACDDGDEPTPEQTEGPYFAPNSPERTSLREAGMAGTRLAVAGAVLTTRCRPVAGALLDFWHADDRGEYDNEGYRLRGHQFADAEGRYLLETIVPGLYVGRTRHIHVKVQAPGQPVLTTQLYFPGEAGNEEDRIFAPALLMDVDEAADGIEAGFTFVLDD